MTYGLDESAGCGVHAKCFDDELVKLGMLVNDVVDENVMRHNWGMATSFIPSFLGLRNTEPLMLCRNGLTIRSECNPMVMRYRKHHAILCHSIMRLQSRRLSAPNVAVEKLRRV